MYCFQKLFVFFFFLPGYGDSTASKARGASRTGQIPMQRTMGQKRVARPAPMVPSREPPYRTRPPGTTPASAAGLSMQARLRTLVPAPQDST